MASDEPSARALASSCRTCANSRRWGRRRFTVATFDRDQPSPPTGLATTHTMREPWGPSRRPVQAVARVRPSASMPSARRSTRSSSRRCSASLIRIGATVAVIRRRIASRAVSRHTHRVGKIPYGKTWLTGLAPRLGMQYDNPTRQIAATIHRHQNGGFGFGELMN